MKIYRKWCQTRILFLRETYLILIFINKTKGMTVKDTNCSLYWNVIAVLPVRFRLFLADLTQFLGNISHPLLPHSSPAPSFRINAMVVTWPVTQLMCVTFNGRSWGTTREEGQEVIPKQVTAFVDGLDSHGVPLGHHCISVWGKSVCLLCVSIAGKYDCYIQYHSLRD